MESIRQESQPRARRRGRGLVLQRVLLDEWAVKRGDIDALEQCWCSRSNADGVRLRRSRNKGEMRAAPRARAMLRSRASRRLLRGCGGRVTCTAPLKVDHDVHAASGHATRRSAAARSPEIHLFVCLPRPRERLSGSLGRLRRGDPMRATPGSSPCGRRAPAPLHAFPRRRLRPHAARRSPPKKRAGGGGRPSQEVAPSPLPALVAAPAAASAAVTTPLGEPDGVLVIGFLEP